MPGVLRINPEYRELVPPKSDKARDDLRVILGEQGVKTPFVVDRDGAVLFDMEVFEICQEMQLEGVGSYADFDSEAAKKKWIAAMASTDAGITSHQATLIRWRQMEMEAGTIEERAEILASRYPVQGKRHETIVNHYKEAHAYGTLATSDRVHPDVYRYIWNRGAITRPDLQQLSSLPLDAQGRALQLRVEKGVKSWKKCLFRVQPEEIEGADTLKRLVAGARSHTASMRKWASEHKSLGTEISKKVDDDFLVQARDFERACMKLEKRF